MRQALNGKSVRFDKDRSALGTIKVFPENVEIEALLTYSPNDRVGLGLDAVVGRALHPDHRALLVLEAAGRADEAAPGRQPHRVLPERVQGFLAR